MRETPAKPVVRPAVLVNRLWAQGQRPDLMSVLRSCGPCPPSEIAAAIIADLRERWRRGERVPVEHYLNRHPDVIENQDALVAVLLAEVAARCDTSDLPRLEEYRDRFPALADTLSAHFAHLGPASSAEASTLNLSNRLPTPADSVPGIGTDGGLPFGPYRLLQPLPGATVSHLARDAAGRPVVVKLPDLPVDAREVFLREARAARSFAMPGLASILDGGELEGRLFLVTARSDGRTLANYFGGRPVSARTAVSLCRAVARAMVEAHECGVVHRRLSVEHVLLDPRATPIVVGFGLGGAEPSLRGLPPEAAGNAHRVGVAGDIWLLGAMLYELLTGTPPDTPLARPSALLPTMDAALDTICLRALDPNPARRYASMAELAAVLDQWCQGALSRPDGTPVVRRFRPAAAAGILGAIAVVGCLAMFLPKPAVPVVPSTAPEGRKAEAAELTSLGWGQYEQDRDYERALTLFDRAIALDPRSARAYLGRGCARVFKGRPDLGLADFERACELEPDNPRHHNARGWAHNEQGHAEEAVAAATRALAESPAFAEAYVTRATAHLHAGRAARALEDADRAVELAPHLPWAWQNRGLAHAALGHSTDAARDFAEAKRLDPRLGP